MSTRWGRALALLLACALVEVAPAAAAQHHYTAVDPSTPVRVINLGANTVADACQLGVTGTVSLVGDIFPPDDVYYVLLKPSLCVACSSQTAITNVHIQLNF